MISRLMYGEKRLEPLLVDSRKLHAGAIPQPLASEANVPHEREAPQEPTSQPPLAHRYRKTAGAERQLTVEAASKPVQLEVDFSKP